MRLCRVLERCGQVDCAQAAVMETFSLVSQLRTDLSSGLVASSSSEAASAVLEWNQRHQLCGFSGKEMLTSLVDSSEPWASEAATTASFASIFLANHFIDGIPTLLFKLTAAEGASASANVSSSTAPANLNGQLLLFKFCSDVEGTLGRYQKRLTFLRTKIGPGVQ